MGFLKAFASAAVLSALVPNSVALDVNLKTNVAVYYVSSLFPQLSPVSTPAYTEFRVKVPINLD